MISLKPIVLLLFFQGAILSSLFAEEGIQTCEFDDVRVMVIHDSTIPLKADLFQGGDESIRKKAAPSGFFNLTVNVFLIQKGKENILVDCGNGIPGGTLLAKLQSHGVLPEKITAILLTHFHQDHSGGLLNNEEKASFPNAIVYLSEPERRSIQSEEERNGSFAQKVFAAYQGRIKTFQFGETIMTNITTKDAKGHTPGQTCYELGRLVFIGDLVHVSSLQVSNPEFCAVFDQNRHDSVKSKKRFLQDISQKHFVVFGAHFPFPGIGTIEKSGHTFQYIPIQQKEQP